ncbi:MAG: Sulfhydrogenase 1 subunit beta [Candidatus Heimdallarchaeota archaeon LC_3]|nr:MAG: Sulfhydrogenase 1 subunit beta [Candidatus Heimdallarchaeota archaeon LC_3]
MKPKKISFNNLKSWIDLMIKRYPVYGPVLENENYDYKLIYKASDIDFEFDRTRLSIKDHFFKPKEVLMTASLSKGNPKAILTEVEPEIIFGSRPCDITALNLFDRVFSGKYPDPYYWAQRDKHIIIGMRCIEKCRTSFCGTMDSYDPKTGYDIIITKMEEKQFLVEGGSEKGRLLINESESLFDDVVDENLSQINKIFQEISNIFQPDHHKVGFRALMNIGNNLGKKLHKEYGEICLSCGQCTFVCPTCWCFNVYESISADPEDFGNIDKTARTRQWTSCLLKQFHTVSGDPPHVFKRNVSSRLEAWYDHKFKGIIKHYGVFGCVGCGRCYSSCPVGINIRESLSVLTGVGGD